MLDRFHGRSKETGLTPLSAADAVLVGSWTGSSTGVKSRIPVEKINSVTLKLGATALETDELMQARLAELEESDPGCAVLIVRDWTRARVNQKYALSEEEQLVVDAYRSMGVTEPIFDAPERIYELISFFRVLRASKEATALEAPASTTVADTARQVFRELDASHKKRVREAELSALFDSGATPATIERFMSNLGLSQEKLNDKKNSGS